MRGNNRGMLKFYRMAIKELSAYCRDIKVIPRPPRPAFVAFSTKSGGPGRSRHVIRVVTDVTDFVNTYSQYSICSIQFAIACSRDATETRQTPDQRQVLPILDLKQNCSEMAVIPYIEKFSLLKYFRKCH